MSNHIPWLTVLLCIPLGSALLLQLVPRDARTVIKGVTIAATAASAVLVGVLVASIPHTAGSGAALTLYFQERLNWVPALNTSYHLGIDGMSAWLLALNAGVFLLGALAVSARSTERLRFYCSMMLVVETATTGVLLSLDLLLFYVFWEGMLVPLYFLLANFGSEKRGPATLKFIVYTVAGSLLMLIAIIYLAFVQSNTHSFDLQTLIVNLPAAQTRIVIGGLNLPTLTPSEFMFICFALAFAIKMPIVPFHTWLPDLYESQPASTLTFFAGVVSKMGAYGFIRFGLTLFPEPMHYFKWILAAIAVMSIVYGALMALSQRDIKRIVAYASISHLGFIALGIFVLNDNGLNGAIIQIINHGIIIASLFLIVGIIEARTGTRDLHELSGLEKRMPWLYFFFLIATLAGLGMPGMNTFVGEFTIMLGAFQLNWIYAVVTGGGVVLACWYMLRLHQGVMHNALRSSLEAVRDIRVRDGLLLAPLVALMVFLGVYPKPVGDIAKPTVAQYVGVSQERVEEVNGGYTQ